MTAHVVPKSASETTLARQFEALGPVSGKRQAAFWRFADAGLPTRKLESWHYMDLRALMTEAAPPASTPSAVEIDAARTALAGGVKLGARIVLVNGFFVQELSDPLSNGSSLAVGDSGVASVDDPIADLNEAMSADGPIVVIDPGAVIDKPIEVVHVSAGENPFAFYSRCAITVGAGGSASILETHIGGRPGLQRNIATVISLSDRARLTHAVAVADEPSLHIESQIVRLSAGAALDGFALLAGAAVARRQIFARLDGAEARIALSGLALLNGTRRADTALHVHHSAVRGVSREFFRSIVDDEAIGTFQGKVVVAKGAQKTDGGMKSQAVLLSPRSQMNAKPELEIFADDVVCGHGATVSALDPEQLFYLEARGIPPAQAQAMLLEAFGQEAIDKLEDEALVENLRQPFLKWLASKSSRGTEAEA